MQITDVPPVASNSLPKSAYLNIPIIRSMRVLGETGLFVLSEL
jgi:hypothetical protein